MKTNIKAFLVKTALKLFSFLPMKNIILFESSPDFACNTYPVYEAIKQLPEASRYRLIWFISDDRFIPDDFPRENTVFLEPCGIRQTFRHLYYRAVASCIVMCNRVKEPVRKRQMTVFLNHGSNVKCTKGIYEVGKNIDYVLSQSHFFDKVMCYELDVKPESLFHTGYPRCDVLYHDCSFVRKLFGVPKDAKLIMWLPTYRKHKNHSMQNEGAVGIPILRDREAVARFSESLENNNSYVFLKPHPAEDLSTIEAYDTPRFKIITDADLADKNVRLYELLSASDALITDYSSVLYDFLLCDRPIGVTTEDAKDYAHSRGFALDIESLFSQAAESIADIDELCGFIKRLSLGEDKMSCGRCRVRDITNMFLDDKSALRTARFIISKLDK